MGSIALKSTKYALTLLLILNFILPLIITLVVNQEAWFFGYKLCGIKASSWLLTNGIIGLILAYSFLLPGTYLISDWSRVEGEKMNMGVIFKPTFVIPLLL